MSEEFYPPIGFEGQRFAFLAIAFWAFVFVVAFFLYENVSNRKLVSELVMAVVAAFTLGAAIFFALVRADVIL